MFKGEERVIAIPGFEIGAREWGPKEGLPVLAIHGWLDNASSFEYLAPLIPHAHIVAIDTPGCGHSSHRSIGTIPSIVDEIFHVLQIANALGWEKFTLLGHSRGGALAQLIAAGAPERIESVILIDIIGFYTSPEEDAVTRLRDSIKSFFKPQRPASVFPDLNAAAKGRMTSSVIAFESAMALAKRGTKAVENGVVWTFDRRELNIATALRYSDKQLNEILTGIEARTCVILAQDGILKDAHDLVSTRTRCIREHELHWVPGFHHVHMDDAAVVAEPINAFLTQLR